jgi:hypothetical protein
MRLGDVRTSTANVSNPTKPKSSTREQIAIFNAAKRGDDLERRFSR